MQKPLVGIIGGTGLGDALAEKLTHLETHDIETPFGKPSDRFLVGQMGQHKIAFLNRHGQGHKYPPSDIPFAANIYALKTLGVTSDTRQSPRTHLLTQGCLLKFYPYTNHGTYP